MRQSDLFLTKTENVPGSERTVFLLLLAYLWEELVQAVRHPGTWWTHGDLPGPHVRR
jgi:hypothetical protein